MTLPSVTDSSEEAVKTAAPEPSTGPRPAGSADRDMGAALRSVYQRTVDEAVPDDLMALLGKLD